MPKFSFQIVELKKRYPLAISRGVSAGSRSVYVLAEDQGIVGLGEGAPGIGIEEDAPLNCRRQLEEFCSAERDGWTPEAVWQLAKEEGIEPAAMAALDIALWDLAAKKAGKPLYAFLGLENRSVPTSVTIGINPPEVIRERVPEILERTGAKFLKCKLGSPEGIEADKANFLASREASAPFNVSLRVDANGGWSLTDAKHMLVWLAERGVDYVEQPLVEGAEDQLPELFASRPLPIYVDESCRWASDVARLAGRVDGVNLKLMKCGGITEALRIVAEARRHGLKTMIGCMSESSVAIGAGASIGALFDHIDLDSHLNLAPDPATGLEFVEGVVRCREVPGHGVELRLP
ncbi:MAG: dipeptide epimerase [Armatimonadetes bacterium]|nr:dipeptide epimerase [Armatimonadota bacterium]